MTTILVTGAGALLGQGIIRSLRRSSKATRIIAVDPSQQSAGLYWADEAFLVPLARDPRYLDRLREIIALTRPQAIFVGTDVELELLAENRAGIEADFDTHVLVSSPHVVRTADDKYATAKFFHQHGFAHPASALPEAGDEVDALVAQVGYPLIVKPRRGARSVGVVKVANWDELRLATAGRRDLVVQECVGTSHDEYTASVLVFEGRPLASIVMRRDLRDGNTYRAFTESFPELNAATRAWGAALRPHGPANFQFRIDSDGRPKVFEINARFSGTTPLRQLVGFDEVEMCLRYLLHGEAIRQPSIEAAAILRHWSETKVSYAQMDALA